MTINRIAPKFSEKTQQFLLDSRRAPGTHLRHWTIGAHPPRVGASVSFQQSLMVLSWGHGRHSPPVSEAQTLHRE